jgi:hypothetical protein
MDLSPASRKLSEAPLPKLPPEFRRPLCFPPTHMFEKDYALSTQIAVVVQWSAHPTWYPKFLLAYLSPYISLEGRKAAGSNPAYGAYFLPTFCSTLYSVFATVILVGCAYVRIFCEVS